MLQAVGKNYFTGNFMTAPAVQARSNASTEARSAASTDIQIVEDNQEARVLPAEVIINSRNSFASPVILIINIIISNTDTILLIKSYIIILIK